MLQVRDSGALAAKTEKEFGPQGDHCQRPPSSWSAHHGLEHKGTNPVPGIGHEAGAAVWVEFRHCRHQANAPFRDEVSQSHPVAAVLQGDRDDIAQIGFHQRIRG